MKYIVVSPQRARTLCSSLASVKAGEPAPLTATADLRFEAGEYRIYSPDDAELKLIRLTSPRNGKL